MNILLFGGSFDPIHIAHTNILSIAQKQFNIDKIIIIPSKSVVYKQIDANCSHRFEMIKLAMRECINVKISDYEIKQKNDEPSYSINTINHYREIYPNDQIYFLIGADQIAYFSQWKDHEKISNACQLIVYRRNDIAIDDLLIKHKAILVEGSLLDLSSSAIKNNLPENLGLNESVYKYIINNGLYHEYWLPKLMSEHRYEHSIRVATMAKDLMSIHNNELVNQAWIAGIYHDLAKEFKYDQTIGIAKKIKITELHPKIWHGPIACEFLKSHGFTNQLILTAIARHTLPSIVSNEISLLDKVIYCSDKLEIGRTTNDLINIDYYRKLSETNINLCFNELVAYYDKLNTKGD